ncbi:hypothetical protein AALB39_12730 [Lachnospiraceae bacterium 54-53]
MKIPGIRPWMVRAGGAVLLLAVLGILAWHYLPVHYARFYLTRSALQTRGRLKELWGKDQGDGKAIEEALKLVADEVEWNGRSVLVLPGGLGISWKEQRDEKNTFAQGSLDVYFLGAIREGVHYWADQENVVFRIPGITGASVKTTQDTLKEVMGFSIVPEKKKRIKDTFETLKSDTIDMMKQSRIEFTGRDQTGVRIKAAIPADLFDSYLNKIGDLLTDSSAKDVKEWGVKLKERKTEGEVQEVFFSIDKNLNITEVRVEGLVEANLGLKSNDGVEVKGLVMADGRELLLNSRIYFGNGQEGKRAFQIPELNITYHNGRFRLGLKLSGGYEGGMISSQGLEYGKLAEEGGEPLEEGLKETKESFLEKIRILGFDFQPE